MARRIGTAAIGLPLLVLVIWAGGIWFTLTAAAVAAVATLELADLSSARGGRARAVLTVLPVVAVVIYAHFVPVSGSLTPTLAWFSTGAAAGSMLWFLVVTPSGGSVRSAIFSAAIVGLVGGTLLHAPMLRELDDGRQWVMYLFAVTFASDTSAYLVGRGIGRLKLAPGISAGKTWEGAAGGVAGSIAASVAAIALLSLDVSLFEAIGAGAALSIVGQLGDLGESRLKRLAGAKDSGVAVPGHGGVMDRLDSIVWNLVVVYHFVS